MWKRQHPPDNDRLASYVRDVFISRNFHLPASLARLSNVNSLHLASFNLQDTVLIHSLLPSLTSFSLSDSHVMTSPSQFFHFISHASSLRSLEIYRLKFSPELSPLPKLAFPRPRSIHLTNLTLEEHLGQLSLFSSFFSVSYCPFAFQSLISLHLSCTPEQHALPLLLRTVGSDLNILRLEIRSSYKRQGRSALSFAFFSLRGYQLSTGPPLHVLSYTPRLKSLYLFINTEIPESFDWTQSFGSVPHPSRFSLRSPSFRVCAVFPLFFVRSHRNSKNSLPLMSKRVRWPGTRGLL
ncbi:hypothetical protein L218DRAFT_962639 [Marasmius fiardii PR-910]|nr:hypothetical protein L218DRAFT_962639 [Marasmius fiardii PR-910]